MSSDAPRAGRPKADPALVFRIITPETTELAALLRREQARAIKEALQWAATHIPEHTQEHTGEARRSPSAPCQAEHEEDPGEHG